MRGSALLCTALALLGCGGSDLDTRLAAYHEAVRGVLPGASPQIEERTYVALPARRDRRLEAPDHRIGMFDFLALQGCRLSQLVGRRNSALGRVMVPTQRLVYELEVLEAADACAESLREERSQRLRELVAEKRAELPIHVWNAVWMSEEMESYLSASAAVLPAAEENGAALIARAARLVHGPQPAASEGEALEAIFGELRRAESAGVGMRELDRVRHHLDAVALRLEAWQPSGCRGDAVRLRSVFERDYLPLQRDLARLDRRVADQIDALDQIFRVSSLRLPAPPAMLEYHRAQLDPGAPGGAWQRYREAVLRHSRAWEPTLRACGVLPEADQGSGARAGDGEEHEQRDDTA